MQTAIKWSAGLLDLKRLILISSSQVGRKEESSDIQGEGANKATDCLLVHRQGYGRVAPKIQPHQLQKTTSGRARASRERHGACSDLNQRNGGRFHPTITPTNLLIGVLRPHLEGFLGQHHPYNHLKMLKNHLTLQLHQISSSGSLHPSKAQFSLRLRDADQMILIYAASIIIMFKLFQGLKNSKVIHYLRYVR